MKKHLSLIISFLIAVQAWGQTTFEPQIFIKDLHKDPDWDKYGQTIWKTEEEENRKYIGLYEIVADELKSGNKPGPKTINVN